MNNKLIKSIVLCLVLAIVGLTASGCGKTTAAGSTQDRYYSALNSFQNEQEATENTQEYLSTILFGDHGDLTVTSADVYYNNTGTSVPFQRASDAYDTEITFNYNNDNYVIKPKVNQVKKEIEYLNIFKNGVKTQKMKWSTNINQ